MSVAVPGSLSSLPKQGKTKAKARYLKRKKQRRKHKKAEAGHHKQSVTKTDSEDDAGDDEPESDDSSSNSEDINDQEPTIKKLHNERPSNAEKENLSEDVSGSESESEAESSEKDTHTSIPPQAASPTATPAFPSFPLPVAPDAPSKSALSLQGLDSALLAAELIDPSKTISVDALNAKHTSISGGLPVISEKTKKRLSELGILEFFAVQTALLPFLLPSARRSRALYCPYDPPRDVCVSAPTGSGKTLAYVIPIIEILSSRITTRLRALVVLPTRDLVLQVQETFEALNKGRGLKIGVATGQHSFSHEQSQLVYDTSGIHGGTSKVDILVCTPGRLIDHLNGTPGFTLQHLRFLVIDEADRLLAQSFQDWLAQVLSVLRTKSQKEDNTNKLDNVLSEITSRYPTVSERLSVKSQIVDLPYHDAFAPLFVPHISTAFDDQKHVSCQKLLFSATLTRNPSRIAALGLRDPKYFVVQNAESIYHAVDGTNAAAAALGAEEFAMPAGLSEHYVTMSSERKPLIMFYLVHQLGISNALVFTKSASSTARLVKLFGFFEEAYHDSMDVDGDETTKRRFVAQSYSSDLPPNERRTILEKFKKQEIDILVCSDLVARGLDIPHVTHVVSYDVPVDLRKYVHRAGRTARAGRTGDAWTLVEDQEARHFKQMMRSAGGTDDGKGRLKSIKRVRVNGSDLSGMEPSYDVALEKLKEAYSRNMS